MKKIMNSSFKPIGFWLLALIVSLSGSGGDAFELQTSHAGKLLVAKPDMGDPRFAESVILMIEHSTDGAFGLVINKPVLEVRLAEIAERFGIANVVTSGTTKAHFGGPVEPNLGFIIHSNDYASAGTIAVTDTIAVSRDARAFRDILGGKGPQSFVFVMGYAGWSAGQLEAEIARNDWEIAPADREIVLGANSGTKWQRALLQRLIEL